MRHMSLCHELRQEGTMTGRRVRRELKLTRTDFPAFLLQLTRLFSQTTASPRQDQQSARSA